MLRRDQLVLGLVTTFGGSTIPVYSRPLVPTQPGHPSVGRCNEWGRWFRPPLGKKRRVLHSSRRCDQDCLHTGWSRLLAVNLSWSFSRKPTLYASLIGSNPLRSKHLKGDELPRYECPNNLTLPHEVHPVPLDLWTAGICQFSTGDGGQFFWTINLKAVCQALRPTSCRGSAFSCLVLNPDRSDNYNLVNVTSKLSVECCIGVRE